MPARGTGLRFTNTRPLHCLDGRASRYSFATLDSLVTKEGRPKLVDFGTSNLVEADVARREARRAEQINAFLNDRLGAADPSWYNSLKSKGGSVTLLEVVDEMRGRIASYFAGDPEVEIGLRRTIGRMSAELSKPAEARAQLQLALPKQLPVAPADDPSLGMLYVDLAGAEYRSQQATEAERDAASAVRILEKARGRENREALISAYNYLGVSRSQNCESFAEQSEPLRRALEIDRGLYGNEGPTLVNLSVLATTNLKAGHFDEAEKYLTEAIAISDARPGPKGYEYTALLRDGARLCLESKDLECAARRYQAALDFIRPFEHGNGSVFTINVREWLALTNGLRGDYARVEQEFQAVGAQMAATGGPTAESYLAGLDELRGQVYMAAGKFELAERRFRDSLKFYREHRRTKFRTRSLPAASANPWRARVRIPKPHPFCTIPARRSSKPWAPNYIWTVDACARVEPLR